MNIGRLRSIFRRKSCTKRYFSFLRRRRQSCEEDPVDCCGRKMVKPKKQESVVIEKDCGPCIFDIWTPKIPQLGRLEVKPKKSSKEFKKRKCFAGMKSERVCLEDVKKEAAKCFQKNSPGNVPKKMPPEIPDKVQSCSQEQSESLSLRSAKKTVCIPAADWNHDGIIQ